MNTTGPDRDLVVREATDRLIAQIRRTVDDGDRLVAIEALAACHVRGLDVDDLTGRDPVDLAGAVTAHWRAGRCRAPGETVVRVVSPERAGNGWASRHSVVFVVCDDAPFLVDSVRMALEHHGVAVHLLVHPMLRVTRGADGEVRSMGGSTGPVEAWSMIEIDRVKADDAAAVEARVREAIAEVHLAVGDFDPMRRRMSDVASDLEHLPPEGVAPDEIESSVRLLRWLTRRNFVLLGAATYDRTPDGGLAALPESGLGLLRRPHVVDPPPSAGDELLAVNRADGFSHVHRPARPFCVAVRRFDARGTVRGEHRFIGLLAATAYRASVLDIPHVRERAHAVLRGSGFPPDSHDGRMLRTILETFPRDDVFELDAVQLGAIASAVLALGDRPLVRVVVLPRSSGRWSTLLVHLPRARFDAGMVDAIADRVRRAMRADMVTVESFVGTSPLARLTVTVRCPHHDGVIDLDALEREIDEMTRPWAEELRRCMSDELGEADGLDLADRLLPGLPPGYRASTAPESAVGDLVLVASLPDGGIATRIVLGAGSPTSWRVKVFSRGAALMLGHLVPILENLGMGIHDEQAHVIAPTDHGTEVHVHDVGVDVPIAVEPADERLAELRRTLEAVIEARVENDGFNRLVLLAGLTAEEIAILRSYTKYLHQIGFGFSQSYVEDALSRHPDLARSLVDVFVARFDPSVAARDTVEAERVQRVVSILDAVPSLDDDRIGRTLLGLLRATNRTNAYRADRGALAFKFDPGAVPDLPRPRPWAEIWVCSPVVEGVHLRGGAIARGGIRWSDRREDFRTEVLGLVKAQMVKNAVIVPVGAKGGFVVKRPAPGVGADRVSRDEVVSRYRAFISALLDVTDDIRGGQVAHPVDVVCHDADDPYLVVAADRGTSNLSDVANEIATSRGFWLGDAFASGGSAGYDHKEMGITARGAWESVRRHARTLGIDADRDPLTVVGIGDMSGDVFGNGMLRSRSIRLVAAFDHRHVFLDPDPDPETSYTERERLFALPESSWADYDTALLSAGGTVVARTAKQVTLSPQAAERLGLPTREPVVLTPDELIRSILCAPVDLLWNGGIGTYVKSSTEKHLDVGDRANDAVRVDGRDLRCRIVAEGGNLGLTQLARVEYARAGGLVNTDAIDNSAGVDCSDHEVNIKILLAAALADGVLGVDERDALLASMTDQVAELVLDDNRAQTLALVLARRQAAALVDVHRRYLDVLEGEGWLDRSIEFLPSDRELADRQGAGEGLATPEFAVLLAYTKHADVTEVLRTDLPDDPHLRPALHRYFPAELQARFGEQIDRHRLRREIVATAVVNEMVNTNGITFDHRLTEETGASTADVTRAWIVARDIVDARTLWSRITDLEAHVRPDVFVDLLLELRRMVERSSLWLLRHRRPPIDLADTVARLGPGVARVGRILPEVLAPHLAAAAQSTEASRVVMGVPEELATASSVWPFLHTGFDVVEVAQALDRPEAEVAHTYWEVFDRLGAGWLWDGIGSLPRSDRWHVQARSALRDDLLSTLSGLTRDVLECSPHTGPTDAVGRWLELNDRSVTRARLVQADVARSGTRDLTTLSVGLRQLRNLLVTSRTAPG